MTVQPPPLAARVAERPRTVRLLVWAALALPFVIAAIVLLTKDWYPVLDLAMTEFRVRDVGGSHTPLIGLPGRIGEFPEQGSHPGPLSFYLIAPTYRIFGSSAWGMEAGTILLAIAAIGLVLWIVQRQFGLKGLGVGALIVLVASRGYGIDTLTQPWNPYLPLLAWLVVLAATWAVLCGDYRMILAVVLVGSYCAQTHLPYVGLWLGMGTLAVVGLVLTWRRSPLLRNDLRESVAVAAVLGLLAWLPPILDQVRHDPGNLRMIADYFRNPPEHPVGTVEGIRLALRHLDVFRVVGEMFGGDGGFVRAGYRLDGSILPGLLLLALFIASAVFAWRGHNRRLIALHAVVGWAFVLATISMARIFGKVWFYLTLWAWIIPVLMVVAIVWTGWVELRERQKLTPTAHRVANTVLGVVAALLLLVFTIETFGARPPEPHLSETLGELIEPTMLGIETGAGAATDLDGSYMVTWDDAMHFGSQGYGLISELERRGVDAGAAYTWRVPVTPHRVITAEQATAELHLTTGVYVEFWRANPDAVEIATVEPRSPEELVEYAELESELTAGLAELGLDDLIPMIGTNLFGVQIDTRVPPALQELTNRMLELGQVTAVFVLPPGTTQ